MRKTAKRLIVLIAVMFTVQGCAPSIVKIQDMGVDMSMNYNSNDLSESNIDIDMQSHIGAVPVHLKENNSNPDWYYDLEHTKIEDFFKNTHEKIAEKFISDGIENIKIKISFEISRIIWRVFAYQNGNYGEFITKTKYEFYDLAGREVYEINKDIRHRREIDWKNIKTAFGELTKETISEIASSFQEEIRTNIQLTDKLIVATNEAKAILGNTISKKSNSTDQATKQKKSFNTVNSIKPTVSFTFNKWGNANNGIAVIIGNRNYSAKDGSTPDVDYALNDADLIRRYIVESLGYREGNIIDLRDATQANLVSVFGNDKTHKGKLFNWLRSGESDVFVYYSGHGAPGLSNGHGYLLPVDADPNTVELNGYPLETLYANLGRLPAKSITVVIDACFSGGSQAGTVVKSASSISLKVVEAKNTLPHATILTASDVSEVASWDEEARLGLFTRHFLEGVTGKADQDKFGNGDGQVTLGELKNYLENEVTYMARRLFNREQHPQVSGKPEKVMTVTN